MYLISNKRKYPNVNIMDQENQQARIELLKFLSYRIEPARASEIRELLNPYFPKVAYRNSFLDLMCEQGEVIELARTKTNIFYQIPLRKVLDYMWDITETDAAKYKKIANNNNYSYSWMNRSKTFQDFVITWRNSGMVINYQWTDIRLNTDAARVASILPFHPKWREIIKFLTDTNLRKIAELCHKYCAQLLNVEMAQEFQSLFIESKIGDIVNREILRMMDEYYTNLLSGNLREISPSEFESAYNLATRAVLHQYAGQHAKAVALYRKTIKEEDNNSELISNPLFSLLYIRALERDPKQSSRKRLSTVYYEVQHNSNHAYFPAILYLKFINEQKAPNTIRYIDENWRDMTPLSFVLSVIVVLHFKMGTLSDETIAAAEAYIDNDAFLLLQLEASSSLPKYMAKREELLKRVKIEPILQPYKVLEPWEKSLSELGDIIETTSKKVTTSKSSEENNSRIIYLLDNGDNFHPRLQKRTSSGGWSKGRNVALNTLATNQCEGMQSIDMMVASCVRCYDTWGGKTYSLSGNSVYRVLINHPLVFSYANPDLAISIVSDTPYLRVENYKNGFRVTSNIDSDTIAETVIVRDSDVSYRVFSLTQTQQRIISLFKKQPQYPASARELLSQLVVSAASFITVHSDIVAKSDKLKSVKGSARITVQLLPISDGLKVELFAKPIEDAAQYLKPNKGEESIIVQQNNESVLVERNFKKEAQNLNIVKATISQSTPESDFDDVIIFDDIYDALDMIEGLQEIEKIARVEWPKGAKIKLRGAVDFGKIDISLRSKMGWFEVDGNIKIDKNLQLSLAELLERLRGSRGRFVELSKGEFISLSESLRKQLSELEAASSKGKKGIQISKFTSSLVNELEENGVKVSKDKAFEELQQRIVAAENTTIKIPPTLQAELRDYQADGYKWMARLAEWGAGACLADDMGLGKTVQSIALLLNRAEQGASLIVAPASVVHNWQSELQRFAPTLNCRILHDNISEREEIINSATNFDVVITTYGLLGRITDLITPKSWNVILLDEAHNIKNRDTKSSKAAMNLNGQFRLMLTGTPIQNHLGEIWNLFNFTNPGLLGSFDHFAAKFINPIEQSNDKVRQRELKRILQPFMLRRTKSEVLDELPTKTEIIHRVELSDAEMAIYENIRESAVMALENGSLNPIQSLAEITKLRQAACHPALVDDSLQFQSAKVTRFTEIATELIQNRHRALVFSQFTSFLSLIKKALDEKGIPYLYLDGSTPIKEREKLVNGFQQGTTPLFLISLKAGGTGLNLTAADYVIHLDPWWNPAIEDQASDRSHRIGQTRAVTIYRLIAQNTIEEKIIELHKSKKSLADSLLEGSNMSHKLSREDMLALLRSQY